MKRVILVLAIFLVSFTSVFAGRLQVQVQPLIGYILKEVSFSIEIMNEELPFDLQSETVNPANGSVSTLSGLRIGTYSLESNCNVSLYVAHTKLYQIGRAHV